MSITVTGGITHGNITGASETFVFPSDAAKYRLVCGTRWNPDSSLYSAAPVPSLSAGSISEVSRMTLFANDEYVLYESAEITGSGQSITVTPSEGSLTVWVIKTTGAYTDRAQGGTYASVPSGRAVLGLSQALLSGWTLSGLDGGDTDDDYAWYAQQATATVAAEPRNWLAYTLTASGTPVTLGPSKSLTRLIYTLRGGGAAEVFSGESFLGHVTGATSGYAMGDYRISALALANTTDGINALQNIIAYGGNPQPIYVTATLTRGAQAYRIQQITAAAWSYNLLQSADGAAVSIGAVTASGSPSGATMDFTINVTPAYAGSPNIGVNSPSATGISGDNATIPYQATLGIGVGASGTTQFELQLIYAPDVGTFNPLLSQADLSPTSWLFKLDNRDYVMADLEFEWYPTATDRTNGTNRLATGQVFNRAVTLTAGATDNVYLRARLIGAGSWPYTATGSYTRNIDGTWP